MPDFICFIGTKLSAFAGKGIFPAKGYGNDTLDEDMEVYQIIFRMDVNRIPVYRNDPNLRQTSERFLAYPAAVTVLLSNNGIEMITMMGMFEPCEEHQNETACRNTLLS